MRTLNRLAIPGVAFNLGDSVRDELTGFEGMVYTHLRHITGCDTVWVRSATEKKNAEGKLLEECFDVIRLELVTVNPKNIQSMPAHVEPVG